MPIAVNNSRAIKSDDIMDPTKKELYTAKRSSGIDVGAPDVKTAAEDLKSDANPINWIAFKVSSSNSLTLHASGIDGFDGLKNSLNDDDVYYGVIQCTITTQVKYFHIYFIGENVGGMKKGKSSMYKSAIFGCVDAHGEISCNNGMDEFTKDFVTNEIARITKTSSCDIVV